MSNRLIEPRDPIAIRFEDDDDRQMHFFECRMKTMGAALDCTTQRILKKTAPLRSRTISKSRELFAKIGAFFFSLKNRFMPRSERAEIKHIRTHIGSYY